MRYFSSTLVIALSLVCFVPALAQDSAGKDTLSGTVRYFPGKRASITRTDTDLARFKSPGFLEVAAEIIDVDGENQIVNARKSVSLKFNLQPKGGKGETVHIESESDVARLTVADRRLVLTGKVSGFYRIGNGPQTTLSGSKAIFDYSGDTLNATIESEQGSQVEITLPPETNKPDALGPVTVRADELRIDEKNDAAYFIGNARAFSTDGDNKLDVTAPSFTLRRAADGTISTLTTNGKTLTKLDVPPDASATGVGKPTHLEVTSDKATVNRASSTGVFEGNVTGFYRLQAAGTPAQNYNFDGESAIITYDAAAKTGGGLSVVMTKIYMQVPSFNLNF